MFPLLAEAFASVSPRQTSVATEPGVSPMLQRLIAAFAALLPSAALASSHMDAPKITLDDAANTTDVYAFLSAGSGGVRYLTTALGVYPFEEPGIGPNNYRFDDRVRYSIHVALDGDIAKGKPDFTYDFDFRTSYADQGTIRQSYLGPVGSDGSNRNLRQTYRVTQTNHRTGVQVVIGDNLMTPPNNQGRVTPLYNRRNDGDLPAKGGVSAQAALDPYTRAAIYPLKRGYFAFAGQRDDGFFADIHSIFDLDFTFGADRATPTKPFDSQRGFNLHMMVLNIPLSELGEGAKIAGVYATTSRRDETTSRRDEAAASWRQVGRQGNPLFVEALLPIREKDRYNESDPSTDGTLGQFADAPELSSLLGATPLIPGLIRSIFIPDLIKVDLTTGPARLSCQDGFNRLSVFGGDVLKSEVQDPFGNGGFIPGGWPNGRRFGDDVTDIAIIALGLAGSGPDFSAVNADRVTRNDITYNCVFPYAATPLNGRNHRHH
jgi:hypothetical protein